jgi:tetratricopeptide (TPR) repeat protein
MQAATGSLKAVRIKQGVLLNVQTEHPLSCHLLSKYGTIQLNRFPETRVTMNRNNTFILAVSMLVILLGFVPDTWAQDKAEDLFMKGNELSRQGRFEQAVDAYKRSIENNPNATVAHLNLALAYKNLNRLGEAASALERAVELEPGNLDARYGLGNVYNHLERWEDAIAQLNVVVHRRRDDAEAHGNLGWAYYNIKKKPPFKLLVIVNLRRAVDLFESKNQPEAADATRKVLNEAMIRFGYQVEIPPN